MKTKPNSIVLILVFVLLCLSQRMFAQGITFNNNQRSETYYISAAKTVKLPIEITRHPGFENDPVTISFDVQGLPFNFARTDIFNRGLRDIVLNAYDLVDTLELSFIYADRAPCTFTLRGTMHYKAGTRDFDVYIILNYARSITLTAPVNNLLSVYRQELLNENNAYICNSSRGRARILQDKVLDSNLNLVYANVVIGADDIVKTGTAASISQDKDKGVLGINYSTLWKGGPHAINFGINAKTTGGIYNVFSPDSWSKDIGLSAGSTIILSHNSQNFEERECDSIKMLRRFALDSLYLYYNEVAKLDYTALLTARNNLEGMISTANTIGLAPVPKNFKDSLNRIVKQIAIINRIIVEPLRLSPAEIQERINEVVQEDLAMYDYQFSKYLTGYFVRWLDGKISVSNNTLNLVNDSVPQNYRTPLNIKSTLNLSLSISLNQTTMGKRSLTFVQFQGLLERGNFLNQFFLVKSPFVSYDSISQTYTVRSADGDNKPIGSYQNLEKEVWAFSLSGYGAIFFGTDKNFGVDLRCKFRTILSKVDDIDFKNTFDLMAGPVFRWEANKDVSLLTIGIKAGFLNAPVGTQVLKQNFGVKLEIGVPFKWYKKVDKV